MPQAAPTDSTRDPSRIDIAQNEILEMYDMLMAGEVFTGLILTVIAYMVLVVGSFMGIWMVTFGFLIGGAIAVTLVSTKHSDEYENRSLAGLLLFAFLVWPLVVYLNLIELQRHLI